MNRLPYRKPGYEIRRNGCWIWTGTINDRGYGRITVDHLHMPATHWVWEKTGKGVVPGGWELHHLCHERSCVNPEHLLLSLAGAEHRKRDAEKRREGLSAEKLRARTREGWRRSAKKRYYAKKAQGLRRAKRKMPDGYVDQWVPVTAGESAVLQACLEYWRALSRAA